MSIMHDLCDEIPSSRGTHDRFQIVMFCLNEHGSAFCDPV